MRGNRGKGWEARLDHQHTEYRRDRRAVIFKCHPEVKVINGRAVRQKGPPDYLGRVGAVPVCFDAKEGQGDRWPFASLKRHQAVSLEAFAAEGLAGIVLRLKGRGSWWVDWRDLGPLWWAWHETKARPASLSLEWLAEHAQAIEGADWLAAALIRKDKRSA